MGSESNKRKWVQLAGEMVYYALPMNLEPEQCKAFLENHSQHSSSFPALLKLGYVVNSIRISTLQRTLSSSLLTVKGALEALKTTEADFEHSKQVLCTLIEQYKVIDVNSIILCAFISQAAYHQDNETIAELYNNFSKYSRGPRPSVLFAALMKIIGQLHIDKDSDDPMKTLAETAVHENATSNDRGKDLFYHSNAVEGAIDYFLNTKKAREAAVFLFTAEQAKIPHQFYRLEDLARLCEAESDFPSLLVLQQASEEHYLGVEVNKSIYRMKQGLNEDAVKAAEAEVKFIEPHSMLMGYLKSEATPSRNHI